MVWWLWMLLGLALLFIELASGSFFAVFFGLSALVVGGLTAIGLGGPVWLQWALFTAVAVLSLALLRRPLKARLNVDGASKPVDQLPGELALAMEELPAGGGGKVELRGSSWNGRNGTAAAIPKGSRCRVERVEGLTLWVGPE